MHRFRFGFPVVALLACATPASTTFVAPSPANIIGDTDVLSQGKPRHVISVRNSSSVPITVTGVLLTDCVNLRNTCGLARMNVHIPPGNRRQVLEVVPAREQERFTYRWKFQWNDSSGTAALRAMADAGDAGAAQRLSGIQRADSIRRSETGMGLPLLGPSELAQVGPLVRSLRIMPDSIRIRPGERIEMERVNVLLIDSAGQALGRTRHMRWSKPYLAPFDIVPPGTIIGRRIGSAPLHLALSEDAEQRIGQSFGPLRLQIAVGHPQDPRAPSFLGRVVDAGSRTPLGCVSVALEDSARNEVARTRAPRNGTFRLRPAIAGTYRLVVETPGWMPVPTESRMAEQDRELELEVPVSFTEQTVARSELPDAERKRARVISVRSEAVAGPPDRRGMSTPIVHGITLSGSGTTPVLGIIAGTSEYSGFAQFIVDSVGRADTTTVALPATAPRDLRPKVTAALTRVRFVPAVEGGQQVCELMRIGISVVPR